MSEDGRIKDSTPRVLLDSIEIEIYNFNKNIASRLSGCDKFGKQ